MFIIDLHRQKPNLTHKPTELAVAEGEDSEINLKCREFNLKFHVLKIFCRSVRSALHYVMARKLVVPAGVSSALTVGGQDSLVN